MSNSVFKVEFSVVYNNDEVNEDLICDNLFEAMKSLGNGIVLLNIDNVKKLTRANKAINNMLKELSSQKNVKSRKSKDGTDFVEINKENN